MLDSLGKLAATIALLSAWCLIFAVVYNTSYCWVIGRQFLLLYSILDHPQSSIEWLPLQVFGIGIGVLSGARIGLPFAVAPIKFASTKYNLFAVILLGAFGFVFDRTWLTYIFAGILLWMAIHTHTLGRLRYDQQNEWVPPLTYLAGILLIISFVLGHEKAHVDWNRSQREDGSYQVTTNSDSFPDDIRLMRSLTNGLIVLDYSNNQFVFLLWQHVNGIVLMDSGLRKRQPLSCNWFELFCFPYEVDSPPSDLPGPETGREGAEGKP